VTSALQIQEVAAYYESKTEAILARYGPGPRVHYHAGLVDYPPPLDSSAEQLRLELVASQERLLYHAAGADLWDASSTLCGDVLDVGCGLGGGAIFWAQEFGARVTAVTCVESHIALVAHFAARAGVASLVRPLLCDALAVPGDHSFDSAVAIDSSCHLDRELWFRRLATLLRPSGHVFIADCFLGLRKYEQPFNCYWHTRIGTIDQYLSNAEAAGFRAELVDDISHRTKHFWTTTRALINAEARIKPLARAEARLREASLDAHLMMNTGLADGGLRYTLMKFTKGTRS
jgi:SAM-dependent methyltransferase